MLLKRLHLLIVTMITSLAYCQNKVFYVAMSVTYPTETGGQLVVVKPTLSSNFILRTNHILFL